MLASWHTSHRHSQTPHYPHNATLLDMHSNKTVLLCKCRSRQAAHLHAHCITHVARWVFQELLSVQSEMAILVVRQSSYISSADLDAIKRVV